MYKPNKSTRQEPVQSKAKQSKAKQRSVVSNKGQRPPAPSGLLHKTQKNKSIKSINDAMVKLHGLN